MLTRLTGMAILLMAAICWPMAALAADATVETQQNPAVVYLVLILLFAALTSGLFFASPLRSRLMPSTAMPLRSRRYAHPEDYAPISRDEMAARANPQPLMVPYQADPSPSQWPALEQWPPIDPQSADYLPAPAPPTPHAPPPAAQRPWSTTDGQADGPWSHVRREPGQGQS